jgi:hypothetical protein
VHFEQNFFIQKHRISKIDAQFPDFASILAHVYARDLSLNPPESVGFLESLSQGGAIPEQRPRLGLDPKQAHWRSPAPDIFSRIKRLLSRSMRNSSWIVPFISYAIQGASASPIGSTPPKNYNSELWHLLQTFFNGNWDHLIGLPLLFFMLKFLDKGLFRNEDRSATSAFLMVGIAIGLAYAGNAQDFEASHIVLWSMFCLGVVTYYVGPTLRRLSLGRL